MKRVLIVFLGALCLSACVTSNSVLVPRDKNLVDLTEDQEEYELQVLDPGFETWFMTVWSPANDRSLSYYTLWNSRYVVEWNYKATQPGTSRFFNNMIAYDPSVNYGIEVERKLYYYFRWVDTKLGIPILSHRPPGGVVL